MKNHDLISITDLSKQMIDQILKKAQDLKKKAEPTALKGKVLGALFFEPSTRTRLSFEAAIHRMGGNVIGFSSSEHSSLQKGETFSDTIKVISSYVDALILRHPKEGSARLAADLSDVPVINAGDGANQHPTQTLLDLFTMKEIQNKIHELRVALVGDLKYGRTVHSLALALSHYDARLYFIAPEGLTMPEDICNELKKRGTKFSFHKKIEDVLPRLDILYMTRHQVERGSVGEKLRVTYEMLKKAKPHLKVLHPLPRLDELDPKIDNTPFAAYFKQAENGVLVRQAILQSILG